MRASRERKWIRYNKKKKSAERVMREKIIKKYERASRKSRGNIKSRESRKKR